MRLAHDRAIQTCNNAQESKTFKSITGTIKIKFQQLTFHGDIVWKLPTQAWNKEKFSPYTPLKTALSKRENHSTNKRILIGRILWCTSPGCRLGCKPTPSIKQNGLLRKMKCYYTLTFLTIFKRTLELRMKTTQNILSTLLCLGLKHQIIASISPVHFMRIIT